MFTGRRPLPCLVLLATASGALAAGRPITLDLAEGGPDNRVTIGLNVPGIGSDDDVSTITGTVAAEVEIDPDTDQVTALSFTSADVSGTPITLRASFLGLASFNLTSTVIGGNLTTPAPPGTVNADGIFDSAQHVFEINEGSIGGTVNVFGSVSNVNVDFQTDPVGAAGVNPGGVWSVPTSATTTSKTYTVVVIMPLSITEVQTVEGTEVTITANGQLNASGEITVPLGTLYEQWAVANDIDGAPFTGDHDLDGVSNGLLWALGLQVDDDPRPVLPAINGSSVELTLPAGGTAADLWLETSTALTPGSWLALRAVAVSTGTNPLPAGTSGPVSVALPSGDPLRGLRLRVDEP